MEDQIKISVEDLKSHLNDVFKEHPKPDEKIKLMTVGEYTKLYEIAKNIENNCK